MPHSIKPMLAVLTDDPFDNPGWLFEIKHDGYRAIAEVENQKPNVYSRNLLSFNKKFEPIVDTLRSISEDMILDGEVVVLDDKGRSNFQLLQNYQRTGEGDIFYYVFDIIYYNGYDLTNLPLIQRKDILRQVLPDLHNVKYSDHIIEAGKDFYSAAQRENLEGIIAKDMNSCYRVNKRTREWLKIKVHKQQEAVIAGFTAPKGSRSYFGALVLGVYEKDDFIYIGHSGGGFNEGSLKEIKGKLEPLIKKTSPFKKKIKTNSPVTWVEPKLVCQLTFSEWTDEGLMRHPIYMGLREDKDPKEVVIEKPIDKKEIVEESKSNDVEKKEKKSKVTGGLGKNDKEVIINKHKLKLTNLDKVFWPEEGYTKGDLIEYYRSIHKYILPYIKDRPESLLRHPNGIYGEGFFQKNVNSMPPDWAKTEDVFSEHNDSYIRYLICNDEATLVFMANLGCIEINPWFSRIQSLEFPDYTVLDLDPEEIEFDKVVESALAIKEVLDEAGIKSFPKTSGATGIHIYIPLGAKYDYDISKEFAHVVANITQGRIPSFTSLERSPSKRKKKVYLDYLQNRGGQTLAAPYSVRPKPGAPVSTPLLWEEVKQGLDPKDFTIKNIHKRLDKTGDLFKGVLGKGIDIDKCLTKLEKLS